MTEDPENDPLGDSWRDRASALVKGGVGMIPIAGSILGEIVGLFIPNQRLDRIEDYIRRLSERLEAIDEHELRERITTPNSIDLFEDGALQAVRALTDERRDYIAMIVAEGIAGDAAVGLESKRMLRLLSSIDDDQVIILASYLNRHARDHEFHELHKSILEPVRFHRGSDRETADRSTLWKLARADLARLGLLQARFQKPKKGEVPEYGDNGMPKSSGYMLTPLGRLLLRHVGLAATGEL